MGCSTLGRLDLLRSCQSKARDIPVRGSSGKPVTAVMSGSSLTRIEESGSSQDVFISSLSTSVAVPRVQTNKYHRHSKEGNRGCNQTAPSTTKFG